LFQVGGESFSVVVGMMNIFGRVAMCGAISEYNLMESKPLGKTEEMPLRYCGTIHRKNTISCRDWFSNKCTRPHTQTAPIQYILVTTITVQLLQWSLISGSNYQYSKIRGTELGLQSDQSWRIHCVSMA